MDKLSVKEQIQQAIQDLLEEKSLCQLEHDEFSPLWENVDVLEFSELLKDFSNALRAKERKLFLNAVEIHPTLKNLVEDLKRENNADIEAAITEVINEHISTTNSEIKPVDFHTLLRDLKRSQDISNHMETILSEFCSLSKNQPKLYKILCEDQILNDLMKKFNLKKSVCSFEKKFVQKIHEIDVYKLLPQCSETEQRNKSKVIMFLGESGSGKTTMINALVNVMLGVQLGDKFRYTLVVEEFGKCQAESQTSEVSEYFIESSSNFPHPIMIVDTPGFGDTGGVATDNVIEAKIRSYITNNCSNIHAICFVIKASVNRLTAVQQYVSEKILASFSADAAKNIYILMTFADGSHSQAIEALNFGKIPFKASFEFNNSVVFPHAKEKAYDMKRASQFWKMNETNAKGLLKELADCNPIQLGATKKVIKLRQNIKDSVHGIQNNVKLSANQLTNIHQIEDQLAANKENIDNSQNFGSEDTVMPAKMVSKNMVDTFCLNSEIASDSNDVILNDEKQDCYIMDSNGFCMDCPFKCNDTKNPITHETKKVQRIHDDLKNSIQSGNSEILTCASVIESLEKEYVELKEKTLNLSIECKFSLEALSKIALRPQTQSSSDYFDILIQNEITTRKQGYEERVKQLENFKKFNETLGSLEKEHLEKKREEETQNRLRN